MENEPETKEEPVQTDPIENEIIASPKSSPKIELEIVDQEKEQEIDSPHLKNDNEIIETGKLQTTATAIIDALFAAEDLNPSPEEDKSPEKEGEKSSPQNIENPKNDEEEEQQQAEPKLQPKPGPEEEEEIDKGILEEQTENKINLLLAEPSPVEEEDEARDNTAGDDVFQTQIQKAMVYTPISTAQCETALRAFERNGSIPIPEDRPSLQQYIQRKTVNYLLDGDYENAQNYENVSKRFSRACHEYDLKNKIYVKKTHLESRIDETKQQLEAAKTKWVAELKAEEDKEKQRIDSLQDRHYREILEFDDQWSQPEALRPFAKPSTRLLHLRKTEKQMVLAKMFTQAKTVRAEAEVIEEVETETAQQRAEVIVAQKRDALVKRHEAELVHMKDYNDKIMVGLNQKRDNELALIQSRLAKLQHDRDNIMCTDRITDHEMPVLPSPRTRSRMAKYRKTPTTKRLVLRPVTATSRASGRKLNYSLTPTRS